MAFISYNASYALQSLITFPEYGVSKTKKNFRHWNCLSVLCLCSGRTGAAEVTAGRRVCQELYNTPVLMCNIWDQISASWNGVEQKSKQQVRNKLAREAELGLTIICALPTFAPGQVDTHHATPRAFQRWGGSKSLQTHFRTKNVRENKSLDQGHQGQKAEIKEWEAMHDCIPSPQRCCGLWLLEMLLPESKMKCHLPKLQEITRGPKVAKNLIF